MVESLVLLCTQVSRQERNVGKDLKVPVSKPVHWSHNTNQSFVQRLQNPYNFEKLYYFVFWVFRLTTQNLYCFMIAVLMKTLHFFYEPWSRYIVDQNGSAKENVSPKTDKNIEMLICSLFRYKTGFWLISITIIKLRPVNIKIEYKYI